MANILFLPVFLVQKMSKCKKNSVSTTESLNYFMQHDVGEYESHCGNLYQVLSILSKVMRREVCSGEIIK